MNIKTPINLALFISASLLVSACGGNSGSDKKDNNDSSSGNGDGGGSSSGDAVADPSTYTKLNATNATKPSRLDLLSGHIVTDDSWHFGYQKYVGFSVNGGHSGSGKVEGCIAHKYDAIFDKEKKPVASEFKKLTKTSTKKDFEAVTKTSCTTMIKDTLRTEIKTSDWLDADPTQSPPVFAAKTGDSNGWIIRSSNIDAATSSYHYARISVKSVEVALGANTSRKITLNIENWNAETATFNTAVDSPVLDFSDSRVFYDMESNAIVAESDNWDLSVKVEGHNYPIQVNGGASGKGNGGVGKLISTNANTVTDPTKTDQVYKYFGDSVEGLLSKPGNYGPFQYNVGKQHKMWPTFTTYLIKDATRFYKMQVISNYGEDGTLKSGNLVIRHSELN